MLELREIVTAYDQIVALNGVSMTVNESEVLCLLGANGAGKSTLINTISGLLRPRSGQVLFEGRDIVDTRASRIAGLGIVQVPEGRGIFQHMSVEENLLMGAHLRSGSAEVHRDMEKHFDRFPRLAERRHQKAGVLSGGEQQMLAIARALMAKPRLLLLDEPSMGLAPLMVEDVFKTIREIAAENVTILLVEQNARLALDVADRAYVLQNGEIVLSGDAAEMMESDTIKDAYLGAA